MAKLKIDPIDAYRKYENEKTILGKPDRDALITAISERDCFTTGKLMTIALEEDKQLIIDLAIKGGTENVSDFLFFHELETIYLDQLVQALIAQPKILKRATKRFVDNTKTHPQYLFDCLKNKEYILSNQLLLNEMAANTTKKGFVSIQQFLV